MAVAVSNLRPSPHKMLDAYRAQIPYLDSAFGDWDRRVKLCQTVVAKSPPGSGAVFVVDADAVRHRYEMLPMPASVKPLRPDPGLFGMFQKLGMGMTLDDGDSLTLATKIGFDPAKIFASFEGKDEASFEWIVRHRPGALCVESVQELQRFHAAGIRPSDTYQPILYVRMRAVEDPVVMSGRMPTTALHIALAAQAMGFQRVGYSVALDPTNIGTAQWECALLDVLPKAIGSASKKGLPISHVDLGNAFPCQSVAGAHKDRTNFDAVAHLAEIRKYIDALGQRCSYLPRPLTVHASPTDFLLVDATTLLLHVVDVKSGPHTNECRVLYRSHTYGDMSASDPATEQRKLVLIPVPRFASEHADELSARLMEAKGGGETCDGRDLLTYRCPMPENIQPLRDYLMVCGVQIRQGAEFNGSRLADILVASGTGEEIDVRYSEWKDAYLRHREHMASWRITGPFSGQRQLDDMNASLDRFQPVRDSRLPAISPDRVAREFFGKHPPTRGSYLFIDMNRIDYMQRMYERTMPRVKPFVAIKGLCCLPVQSRQGHVGAGFEAASPDELFTTRVLGHLPSDRNVVSLPAKNREMLEAILMHKPRAVTFDSLEDAGRLAAEFKARGWVDDVVAFWRLRFDARNVEHPLGGKYGSSTKKAAQNMIALKEMGFTKLGWMAHRGCMITRSKPYEQLFRLFKFLTRQVGNRAEVDYHNISGGLCAPDQADKHGTSLEDICSKIGAASERFYHDMVELTGREPHIFFEPGRSAVAAAGTFFTKITAVYNKESFLRVQIADRKRDGICGQLFDLKKYSFKHFSTKGELPGRLVDAVILAGSSARAAEIDPPHRKEPHQVPVMVEPGDFFYFADAGAYIFRNAVRNPYLVCYWQREDGTLDWILPPENDEQQVLLDMIPTRAGAGS